MSLIRSLSNRSWATVILEALSRHQVVHLCIAPGSRSTPLTLEAAANKKFICHTHFDERGLGFLALGLAKGSRQPVAIIVTSGTAVANLYPAIVEANLTGQTLILLTADRPIDQINCGANQAIEQQGIFSSHVNASLNLPQPGRNISPRWLVSAIDDAVFRCNSGCLHLNCPFPEPLYNDDKAIDEPWLAELGDWWTSEQCWLEYPLKENVFRQFDWPEWQHKKGVIIAGRLSACEGQRLSDWAEKLGWPLLADVQSSTGQPLPYADLWLNQSKAQMILAKAEIVLQFGSYLTGKRLLNWQASCRPQQYWLIDNLEGRRDPAHHHGRRIIADIKTWLMAHPVPDTSVDWAAPLTDCADQAARLIRQQLSTDFGEAQIASRLAQLLAPNGLLFLGNSLSIRLIDALAQLPKGYPVFANRGASGIDGLIATAAGVSRCSQQPLLMVVGDISALYDLNSLALLRDPQSPPLVILLINNNGGSIFSMLPTPEAERERFYRMPHQLNFAHAAAMFELDYAAPTDWSTLLSVVTNCWRHGGVTIVEVAVAEHDGARQLNQWVAAMEKQ